jgi:hypothetical protein
MSFCLFRRAIWNNKKSEIMANPHLTVAYLHVVFAIRPKKKTCYVITFQKCCKEAGVCKHRVPVPKGGEDWRWILCSCENMALLLDPIISKPVIASSKCLMN